MLYEFELQEAPILCFSCARILELPQAPSNLCCPECGYTIAYDRYREFYRHAFYAARYGIQYREFYDRDDPPSLRPSLAPLGELGTFIALAVASGVLGNAAYDDVKHAVRRILEQRELCKGHGGVTFTESETEQLISYLTDYEPRSLSGFATKLWKKFSVTPPAIILQLLRSLRVCSLLVIAHLQGRNGRQSFFTASSGVAHLFGQKSSPADQCGDFGKRLGGEFNHQVLQPSATELA